jgi:hypothetical protein
MHFQLSDDFLGCKITARGVVLVEGVNSDSSGVGSSGLCEFSTEIIVAAVCDADPINGAQHNGLIGAQDHDAAAAQSEFVDALYGIIRHRGAERRCCINVERNNPEIC